MKKLLLVFFLSLAVMVQYSFSQTIKGKVVDETSGEPVIGASVYLKGTTYGTITDLDGKFSLDVPAQPATLVVSFLGYQDYTKAISPKQGEILDLGEIKLKSSSIGLEEVKVVASFAVDRRTPVSVSRIEPATIEEKLSNQEFPEILKLTPSVYATKQGGGFGDARINLRGFDSRNFAVMINGVPVNDMENGKVYWSNWAGLSDVTRNIQVQRGLGASRLAISSVGGTINILTKTTDVHQGGSVFYSMGNNNYRKTAFTLSTGLLENGWAVTVSASHTSGDGYIMGTNFDAYSYFFNVAKKFNKHHTISITGFGAPQWHNQRPNKRPISFWLDNPYGIRYNPDWGWRHGKVWGGGYAYNQYHKPMFIFNHFWTINSKTQINTAIYASYGRGGGRRILGPQKNLLLYQYPSGLPYDVTLLTPEGQLDIDSAIDINYNSLTGAQVIAAMAKNEHDWYGILSSLNTKVGNVNITAGLDARYYKGYHYTEITDLLGGEYYLDNADINRDPNTPLHEGDKIYYYNIGLVYWAGTFLQAEYVSPNNKFSAFLSGSAVKTFDRRIDYFQYTPDSNKSPVVSFFTYSVKGGLNYNLTSKINFFINGGYFTRPPQFRFVFLNYTNDVNTGAVPEKVLSSDAGIGYVSDKLRMNLYAYYTIWKDKTLVRTMGTTVANIRGIDAIHKGLEAELQYKPFRTLTVHAMGSLGDWRWANDVVADIYDEQQNLIGTVAVYAKGIHVGDAAQTTAALSMDWEALPKLWVSADWTYYDRLYAYFDVENRTDPNDRSDAWELPSYNLLDLGAKYKFKLGGFDATLYGKVNNALNTTYISDALDGNDHDAMSSYVFFGFGRTWTLSLKVHF